jgi:hypothetical protein
MVVMLLRINQLVEAAGTVQIHFLGDLEAFQNGHHPEDRGVIRGSRIGSASRLDFLQGKRFLGAKQGVDDLDAIFGDPHTIRSQELNNRIQRELFQRIWICVGLPSHEGTATYLRRWTRSSKAGKVE